MKPTPFATVTADHGGKDKLAEKVADLIERVGARGEEAKDALKDRLSSVSNRKLARLHGVLSQVQEKFGGRDKLVDATLGLLGRIKDADYRAKIASFPVPRLYDLYRSAERRARRAGEQAA